MKHSNNRLRIGGIVAAVVAVAIALAGCGTTIPAPNNEVPEGADPDVYALVPADIRDAGVIKLTTNAEWPPCEYYAEDDPDTMIGFEPDLWNAIAEKMGVKVEAESIPFDQMIPGVVSGRYDVAMECLTDNPEREKQIDFVDMIYSTIGTLATKENPNDVSENPLSICGLKIATVTGSDLATYVQNIVKPACEEAGLDIPEDSEFGAQAQVMLALDSRRIDVTLYAVTSAAFLIEEQGGNYVIFANDSLPKKYGGPVFNKEDTDLRDAWLAAVKAIHEDGQYEAIMKDWGLEINMLDEPGINLATTRPLS